jgi:nitrogen fixation protein FixH
MAQTAALSGKVASMVSGVDAIEIKATIAEHQIDAALAHYRLTVNNDEERYIYFFDTPTLTLLDDGIIARARRVVGDEHDSTVKFRPVTPAEIPAKWCKHRGFKIEADASEKGVVKSASFTMPVEKGLIKKVAAGEKPVAKLFTKEQERFLADMAGRKLDYESLAVLGPLKAHRWDFMDPGCPWEITAELWKREDGDRLMELSIKASIVQAAAAIGGFRAFLAEVGAQQDADEQSKTRWALGFYAGRIATDTETKA